MDIRLTRMDLRGYKTIRSLDNFEIRPINVLIGANGVGKSNFISFFKMLSWMTASQGDLQRYIAKVGGASSILHDGPSVTPQLEANLSFETDSGTNDYAMRLFHAAGDTLIFADETYRFSRRMYETTAPWKSLGAGHRESGLFVVREQGDLTAKTILRLLDECVVHQFHNTSETARIRQKWDVEDSRFLKEDGGNLAPFLLRLRVSEPAAYGRIVRTIQQIIPFFADFVLNPDWGRVLLQWRESGSDLVFGAHQASDGMLRTIALIALLMQPEKDLPSILILDEPELGLHPMAIQLVAGLVKSVSLHSQVIIATQSTTLIDQFDVEDIVVVDRPDRASRFQRLDRAQLEEWLDEYSLSELVEKNVIPARPA